MELKPISKQSEDTQGIQVDKKTPSHKGKLCIAVHYMKQACTPAHWVSGVFCNVVPQNSDFITFKFLISFDTQWC